LFAQGLVTTPEDFGTRADPPSHPGLLDWLASDFREHGSFKKLIRTIVLSGTYRQSSRASAKALQMDPGNVWLARGVRQRVEAESIRDIAMTASGLLDDKVGGESAFPRIPDGLINTAFGNQQSVWKDGEGKYRRGMYVFFKRAAPYPSLSVFDAPGAETACVRRARSNTPLQALTTLNDPVFVEAAQAMGLRVFREGGKSDAERITYAHRLATGRPPDAAEMKTLTDFLRKQRQHFAGNTASAVLVTAVDPANPPENLDLHQVAPWTLLSRLLLNLDETITKE
jgi:hypothetical protein